MKCEHETRESDKKQAFGLGIICKFNIGKAFDQRWVGKDGFGGEVETKDTHLFPLGAFQFLWTRSQRILLARGVWGKESCCPICFHHYHGTTYISEWRKKESRRALTWGIWVDESCMCLTSYLLLTLLYFTGLQWRSSETWDINYVLIQWKTRCRKAWETFPCVFAAVCKERRIVDFCMCLKSQFS